VAGQWRYVYRAIDQLGQIIDVFVSRTVTRWQPDGSSSNDQKHQGHACGGRHHRATTYPIVLDALHRTEQYANNHIETDHGRLKARLRPMRGLKQDRSAKIIIAGHGLVQNVRRGFLRAGDRGAGEAAGAVAFGALALAI
jgi:IS6 family transposase